MNSGKSILIFIAAFGFLLAAGCGNDDDNPTDPGNNVPAELVGTWYLDSATANGTPISPGAIFLWSDSTEAARIIVGADGSLIYEEMDADSTVIRTENGTFMVDGNSATITISQLELNGTWALNESQDELTLSTTYLGAQIVLVAVKYE